MNFECSYCHKIFSRSSQKKLRHHFCNNDCKKKFIREKTLESRKCANCGKVCKGRVKNIMFCSKKCKKEFIGNKKVSELDLSVRRTKYSRKFYENVCKCCGKSFKTSKSEAGFDIGQYCCTKCAKKALGITIRKI